MTNAYFEGRHAFYMGRGIDENPYDDSSDEAANWCFGWTDAEDEGRA